MTSQTGQKKVLVIHGPNLNLLGRREPTIYGSTTLDQINSQLTAAGRRLNVQVDTFQSNSEGGIVDKIQSAIGVFDGLIINPAAYTHTSIAIRDAILMVDAPVIEIHLTNIHRREQFRHHSMLADVAVGQIVGLGVYGYELALQAMARLITEPS